MKNITQPGVDSFRWEREPVPVESAILAEAGDEYALTVLRYEGGSIDNARLRHVISQLIAQCVHDDPEGLPFVVAAEVLDVLKKEGLRPFLCDDALEVEKECALSWVVEAVCSAETVLLADASETEWLAGKTCDKKIVIRHRSGLNLPNVSGYFVVISVICAVGLAGVLIPLRCEHTPASRGLKTQPSTSDPSKQIDKRE